MADHRLLLLRHAQAADAVPGLRDHERPLTDYGIEQATSVGSALRSRGLSIDQVLCSTAVRTRQTWSALGMDAEVKYSDGIYNASSDSILKLIRLLDEDSYTAIVVGHGPGLPTLAAQLAGPGSDPHLLDVINSRYPLATVSAYEVDGPWDDLEVARLSWLHVVS